MPLVLDLIPVSARLQLIDLGRQFGYADVVAQAEQTLRAAGRFASEIAEHGFIHDDVQQLRDALTLLGEKTTRVSSDRLKAKRTSQTYVGAMRVGKTARQRAQAILHIIVQRLAMSGDPIEVEAARAVSAMLQQTESSRGEPARLASQLDQLRAALSMPRVDRAAMSRGGPASQQELAAAAEALRRAARIDPTSQAAEPPPPSVRDPELAELDLLCGLIVELVRDARRAARSAARARRNPAIASAFELTMLYGGVDGGSADTEPVPSTKA